MRENSIGRMVPDKVDGRNLSPFRGAFARDPGGRRRYSPKLGLSKPGDSKLCKSIREALEKCEIRDSMTISFHHHLRNSDAVINMVIREIAQMGIKDLTIFPSALFPVHKELIEYIKRGVISSIEGSINGPIGDFASHGNIPKTCILRSHGGRVRAVEAGDVRIDIAFIAAPAADDYGNATGLFGKSACGPLAHADIDSREAERVVIITDNLVNYPLIPHSIPSTRVDCVVPVESIRDASQTETGTVEITKSPVKLLIAKYAVDFLNDINMIKQGFSFQTGPGGLSLAITRFMADKMREKSITAQFINGGITQYAVGMLREGLVNNLINVQAFDKSAVESLHNDMNHYECSADEYANYYSKGCLVNKLDIGFLGATEVDLDFNVNINTHRDGRLLHGIGSHSDVAAGSKISMIVVPSYRKRLPVITDWVTTVTTPGETVDVIITEFGAAINPRRSDLIDRAKESASVPLLTIDEMKEKVEKITGRPAKPELKDRIIALIEYRDGTIIDTVREVM